MHKWKQDMKNNDIWACECIGPQNGEPRCPCQMKNTAIRDSRYIEAERDLGSVSIDDYNVNNSDIE